MYDQIERELKILITKEIYEKAGVDLLIAD